MAINANVKVEASQLQTASNKLAQDAAEYKKIYTELLRQASEMGSAWEGKDNVAFVNQINGICGELEAMSKKLGLASEAIKAQGQNYAKLQESLASGIRKY